MKAEITRRELELCGLAPVVVLEDPGDAVPLAKALLAGGIRFMEITFRTGAAEEAIRRVAAEVPDMIVGAGTVINGKLAETAVKAGARFVVTPGYSPEAVAFCHENDVAVVPGTATMTEIMMAINDGCELVKLFPAEDLGGVRYIKSVVSVFPRLQFMPSGGIGFDNMEPYARCRAVAATTGSWLAPKALIREGRFDEITEIARRSVQKMLGFQLLHVGINSADAEEARVTATGLAELFSLPVKEFPAAYFAGDLADVVKTPFLGEHGHIGMLTNHVERAVRYFEDRGYRFRDNPTVDDEGIVSIFFEKEFGGFAVHLRRR